MDGLIPILTPGEMRRWDRRAISDGMPERVLLESAGRAAAARLDAHFPDRPFLFLIGKGNNGGDGLVAARTLHSWGRSVRCLAAEGVALNRPDLLSGWSLETCVAATLRDAVPTEAVLVDALLGTGARDAPREPLAGLIREVNALGNEVVALDTPSGVDLATGRAPGDAILADLTLTFGALKAGQIREPGRTHSGALEVLEIGLPPASAPSAALVTDAWSAAAIPVPDADAHKGSLGRVVVIAGTAGMVGAAIMIAHAALRAGAGLVHVISHPDARAVVHAALPEVIVQEDDADLDALLAEACCAVIGPGVGVSDAGARLLGRSLRAARSPVVLDADALTLLAAGEVELPNDSCSLLTPHPGEAARLLSTSISEITDDPWDAARRIANRYEATVLLKGRPSIVARAEGGPIHVAATGHSGVATGGMGDTLAGIAGALIGRGMSLSAAAAAAHLAGRAAELAGRGVGLLPRDVAEALPGAEIGLREVDRWAVPASGVLAGLPRSR